MFSSQKSKTRKPIFGKRQQPQPSPTDQLSQTAPPLLNDSLLLSQTQSMQLGSNLMNTSISKSPVYRPHSVAKVTFPVNAHINTRVFSPQRIIAQPSPTIFVQRPLTPKIQKITTFNKPTNFSEIVTNNQFYQNQPRFQQNLSNPLPRTQQKYEERPFNQKVVRSNQLKPTVVAVERVMKVIGQNAGSREITVFKPNPESVQFGPRVVEPQKMTVYDRVNRRQEREYDKLSQLQEINSILSRKYDALYDEVQYLKYQNEGGEEPMDENSFLRKAAHHFQNLLSVEMHKAMSEIESVHKVQKGRGVQRVQKGSGVHKKELNYSYFR